MKSADIASKKAFIVLNPVAGLVNPVLTKRAIENHFAAKGWQTDFYLTEKDENLAVIVGQAIKDGPDIIVAAGGDGTVAAVAAGMLHSPVPLGIIPIGTWNAIARALLLPFGVARAINLFTGNHQIRELDLMAIGNRLHAMNMGVGFSSTLTANTGRSEKRRLGSTAYFSQFFKQLFSLQQQRYIIMADGKRYRGRAAEIMIANYGFVGISMLESSLNIKPDDGKVDILIFRARTVFDLPRMIWELITRRKTHNQKFRLISAVESIQIIMHPPVAVQADGELIGETPVTVTVIPRCVKVIVPPEKPPVIPLQLRQR